MAATAAAYGKKASPTDHHKGAFDVFQAYGKKPPKRISRRRPKSTSPKRKNSTKRNKVLRSKSVPILRKRRSLRKRPYSPSGILQVIRHPLAKHAIMNGLNGKKNKAIAALFPNTIKNTVGKYMKVYPMKSSNYFAVGVYGETYAGWRMVTKKDLEDDTFRKDIVHSISEENPGWPLLENHMLSTGGLSVADGILHINNKLILDHSTAHDYFHCVLSGMYYPITDIEDLNIYDPLEPNYKYSWSIKYPMLKNWTVKSGISMKERPILYVRT